MIQISSIRLYCLWKIMKTKKFSNLTPIHDTTYVCNSTPKAHTLCVQLVLIIDRNRLTFQFKQAQHKKQCFRLTSNKFQHRQNIVYAKLLPIVCLLTLLLKYEHIRKGGGIPFPEFLPRNVYPIVIITGGLLTPRMTSQSQECPPWLLPPTVPCEKSIRSMYELLQTPWYLPLPP